MPKKDIKEQTKAAYLYNLMLYPYIGQPIIGTVLPSRVGSHDVRGPPWRVWRSLDGVGSFRMRGASRRPFPRTATDRRTRILITRGSHECERIPRRARWSLGGVAAARVAGTCDMPHRGGGLQEKGESIIGTVLPCRMGSLM